MDKLTRAERYKRNYRIVKNTYQDTKLAKRAQTWSDERLFEELGVKADKKTPNLKHIERSKRINFERKLNKFKYAKSLGMDSDEARKLTSYKKEKIKTSYDYLEARTKRATQKQKIVRMDMWGSWSGYSGDMPPEIKRLATKINRETIVAKRPLDDNAKYGYIVAFYMFVENKKQKDIMDIVKPDKDDAYRVHYKTMVKV